MIDLMETCYLGTRSGSAALFKKACNRFFLCNALRAETRASSFLFVAGLSRAFFILFSENKRLEKASEVLGYILLGRAQRLHESVFSRDLFSKRRLG